MIISSSDVNYNLNDFVWLETIKTDDENYKSYYFFNPIKKIVLTEKNKIIKFFEDIEFYSRNYYVVGFFSYELGMLFEDLFTEKEINSKIPYAVFGIYEKPVIFNHKTGRFEGDPILIKNNEKNYKIKNLKLNISKDEYFNNIKRIKNYIYKGDIYQINYTFKYKFKFQGDILNFYCNLKQNQPVSFNAFIKFDNYYILSNSPELFFKIDNNIITTKPMKGTIGRGKNIYEDEKNLKFLQSDIKNISENIMIADLLRNDIGKISVYGSVKTRDILKVEKYRTLFQMTTTVTGRLKEQLSIYDIIKSIFPSGSITGTPKIRSMEIIKELELEPREIYTGSIGFIAPDKKMQFNVAIRTILIKNGLGELGVGGGIVFDSISNKEYQEAKLKAKFFKIKPIPDFSLIETLLYEKNKLKNLNLHLKRLYESAMYFDFKFNMDKIKKNIHNLLKDLTDSNSYKIKILLSKNGDINIKYFRLYNKKITHIIKLSSINTNSKDVFLYHKTTNRKLYNKELDKVKKDNFTDVIFFNENKYITEGSITNVYIMNKNKLFTPKLDDGLLNGIIRQILIKKKNIKEVHIKLDDFLKAEKIFISNSIIGFREAILK